MKIGILTLFYRNYNYGGILQAYALQTALRVLGHDSEILNLDRQNLRRGGQSSEEEKRQGKMIHLLVNKVLNRLLKKKLNSRRSVFDKFIVENTKCSREIFHNENLELANKKYEIFITGSDQVWSPVSGRDATLLTFVEDSSKKNAYAASIGSDEISQEYLKYLSDTIKDYNKISVREERAREILQPVCSKRIEVMVDPVFLIEKTSWLKLVCAAKTYDFLEKNKYVLIYMLGDSRENRKVIHRICVSLKLKEVVIPYGQMKITFEDFVCPGIKITDAGPAEFLKLIADAKYVFTDSFHCMAFSIIMNKKFWGLQRSDCDRGVGMHTRLINLLHMFGMEDRMITAVSGIDEFICRMDEDINWGSINSIIVKKRKDAVLYLEGMTGWKVKVEPTR